LASAESQLHFIESMLDYILKKSSGGHESDMVVEDVPRKIFFVGSLAPRIKETEGDYEQHEGRASIRSQRISVSFLVKTSDLDEMEVFIRPRGYVFVQTQKCEREGKDGPSGGQWNRFGFSGGFRYRYDGKDVTRFPIDFSLMNDDVKLIGIRKMPEKNIWTASVEVEIKDWRDGDQQEPKSLVKISMTNEGEESAGEAELERSLFDCSFSADINGATVCEFQNEYDYEGFRQRYFYHFRPINCQAFWKEEGKSFETRPHGIFEQPNVRPRTGLPGIDLRFQSLTDVQVLIETLEEFIDMMLEKESVFLAECGSEKNGFVERRGSLQSTWEEMRDLVDNYHGLIEILRESLNLLRYNPNAAKCLADTHAAFSSYYASVRGEDESKEYGWRIFQFTFLIASLPSIVREEDFTTTNILHVDTGGGKSEAYFALIVFTALWERSKGKKEGTTALVKFPLRMLSIQQLDRLASVLIHAEKIRKMNGDHYSGDPFSLGFYIGDSDDFPNYYSELRKKLYDDEEKLKEPAPESLILNMCPLCGRERKAKVRQYDDSASKRVLHRCDECQETFYIYLSDTEIYHRRPTVVVSTVDKWASIALNKSVRNLLGGSGSKCPEGHGFIASGDECETWGDPCKCKGKNEKSMGGPVLSIQDEMHLLKEGFGTISSHFEGAMEKMSIGATGKGFHHVAMSATLNGANKQIRELYMKDSRVIPGRCPTGNGSELDVFNTRFAIPNRIIIGIKPNFRDNHYAALVTLLHYSSFIIESQRMLNSDPEGFCRKYHFADAEEAQKVLKQYLIPLSYHLKVQDAEDMDRLKDAIVAGPLNEKYGVGFRGCTATGASKLEELKGIMKEVVDSVANYDPKSLEGGGTINPIYATSVISHGVDLEQLNFMIFQGLPYQTSEYIQALSRVGRDPLKIGVVIVLFYPNRIRDDSFFRNFVGYHETLEHRVRPIPLKRDAKLGKYQTINSLFTAALINYLSEIKGKPLVTKGSVMGLKDADVRAIEDFISSSFGSCHDIKIIKEIEDRLREIEDSKSKSTDRIIDILNAAPNRYYRTQHGMRGIQRNLVLTMKNDQMKRFVGGK